MARRILAPLSSIMITSKTYGLWAPVMVIIAGLYAGLLWTLWHRHTVLLTKQSHRACEIPTVT